MSLVGSWELVKQENFDEYVKAFSGGNDADAKKFEISKATVDIKKDGNKYTFTSTTDSRTRVVAFVPGEEFTESFDGGKTEIKSVASLDGDKIVVKSKGPDGKEGSRIYEANGNEAIVTLVGPNSVTAKRYYRRVN